MTRKFLSIGVSGTSHFKEHGGRWWSLCSVIYTPNNPFEWVFILASCDVAMFYVISGNACFYVRICCHAYIAVLLRYSFSLPFLSEFQYHALLVLFQWTVCSDSFKLYVLAVVQLPFWSPSGVRSVVLVLLFLINAALLGLPCFVDCGSSQTFAVFVHPVSMRIKSFHVHSGMVINARLRRRAI